MSSFLMAFALFLLIEGALPFIAPGAWREAVTRMARMSDGQIRFVGLASMGAGLLLLAFLARA
jgi:uncharacterized protein YjeT (DUF2065 family)